MCLDGTPKQLWQTPLDHGRWLANVRIDAQVWLSAADGFLWRIDMATGHHCRNGRGG